MAIKASTYLLHFTGLHQSASTGMGAEQYEHEFLSHKLIYDTFPPKLPQVLGKIMLLELFWIWPWE